MKRRGRRSCAQSGRTVVIRKGDGRRRGSSTNPDQRSGRIALFAGVTNARTIEAGPGAGAQALNLIRRANPGLGQTGPGARRGERRGRSIENPGQCSDGRPLGRDDQPASGETCLRMRCGDLGRRIGDSRTGAHLDRSVGALSRDRTGAQAIEHRGRVRSQARARGCNADSASSDRGGPRSDRKRRNGGNRPFAQPGGRCADMARRRDRSDP